MADLGGFLGAAGVGSAIGQAVVQLELSTAKYQAELAAAEGKTAASTSKMGSTFSKFGGLAGAAFAAVGVAAVIGLKKSVDAAIEANDAHIKLQNTFANNKNLADSSVAAFEAQADALRDLTGVDDEAIISGQALIGSFGLTGEEVQKLTPLVVDLSEKYDIDLQAAFKAVGKATEGTTGSLSRYIGEIEEGTTPAENFTNVIDKLGGVQGFAAKSAEAEPWRVLSAQFEEVAEQIGNALLPFLRDMVGVLKNLMPLLKTAADNLGTIILVIGGFAAVKYVPSLLIGIASGLEAVGAAGLAQRITQMAVSIGTLGAGFSALLAMDLAGLAYLINKIATGADPTFANQLGHELSGLAKDSPVFVEAIGEVTEANNKLAHSHVVAGKAVKNFAHMTDDELTKWSDDTKESFESYVINLEKVQEETDFTRKDLRDSFQAMLGHARDLNQAMKTLSREHWINDDFVKFLAEQPDKLILFADSNEKQQRKMQDQWEKSGNILKNQINDKLDDMTGILDKLDQGETKHVVRIKYEYENFDPSKPGMGGMGAQP